ncbi:hypothetical protein COOONC_13739 [Cooperia oncophora]
MGKTAEAWRKTRRRRSTSKIYKKDLENSTKPYIKNEDLVDKLKLLNYEEGFLKMNSAFKPIHRYYFVNSTNVGEQFFMFTSLAAWLIRKGGNETYEMPQEVNFYSAEIS